MAGSKEKGEESAGDEEFKGMSKAEIAIASIDSS